MNFSYTSYNNIINYIRLKLPIVSFTDAVYKDKFCVIRHDVEYSPLRALKLAKYEKRIGVTSTYCFQLRNNTYNLLSKENLDIVREISNMGHDIASHIHMGDIGDKNINQYIIDEVDCFSKLSGINVNSFSIHRPNSDVLKNEISIPNIMNLNSSLFFQYFDVKPDKLNVVYLADSNHKWKYGYPYDLDLSTVDRIQLNCHPFSWNENDLNNTENFSILLNEKKTELVHSIANEIKTFPKELLDEEKCYMVARN